MFDYLKALVAKKTAMRAVTVDEVLAAQLGDTWFLESAPVQVATLEHWAMEHNAHHYARPARDFSEQEAMAEAQALGYWCVLVENLG